MSTNERQVPTAVQPDLSDPAMQMQGQKEDPNSVASLNTKAQVLQAQSIADSRYDPPAPASGSSKAPFLDFGGQGVAQDNIKTRVIFFIAGLLLIVFICWYVNPKSTFQGLKGICGFTSAIKLPRIFRR